MVSRLNHRSRSTDGALPPPLWGRVGVGGPHGKSFLGPPPPPPPPHGGGGPPPPLWGGGGGGGAPHGKSFLGPPPPTPPRKGEGSRTALGAAIQFHNSTR
ncbi:hypothetical protein SSBR45R_34190 [Bradyrhizobium sp. SSBR45R]|nr:hypothetical protein SSBR45R_34190 [Bradyrhizobium sp. SSBR45R]